LTNASKLLQLHCTPQIFAGKTAHPGAIRSVLMEHRMYTAADLTEGLPESLRPYLLVDSAELPPAVFANVAPPFWTAAALIAPVVRTKLQVNVVLATAPFRVNITNGELRFTPAETTVHACVNNIIFIEGNLLMNYTFPFQVTSILEELVHVFLNIDDEVLVKHVVALLYKDIHYLEDEDRYVSADKRDGTHNAP
jgi:hypothetical protein